MDARTIAAPGGRLVIEYNPSRPASRMRYSVCHELAHTFFPDCREQVRNRARHEDMTSDEWQLEMLCNIGAAELLMPIGTFASLEREPVAIDTLLGLRERLQVSFEALFLRYVRLTPKPCLLFSASRRGNRYSVDYSVASKSCSLHLPSGFVVPQGNPVEECTAIGWTAKGNATWKAGSGNLWLECVGIPSYPTERYPRVLGIAKTHGENRPQASGLREVVGDATEPRGSGNRIIAHIVNDKAVTWGAGFGLAVRKKWPVAQQSFRQWAMSDKTSLALGNTRMTRVDDSLSLAHMVCQHGYGPSPKARIRYGALQTCLDRLAKTAIENSASVHMPRIGSGEAKGAWPIIKELVNDALCKKGVSVTIYDLPPSKRTRNPQESLVFGEAVPL